MQKKIDTQYISAFSSSINNLKKPVPFISIRPRIEDNDNRIGLVFLNGLNGTKEVIAYFNHPVFANKWLFTFDNLAQGANYNFATKKYKKYVNTAAACIEHLMQKYPQISDWYLIGESWGGAIMILLAQKGLNSKIKGLFFWNMPCKIVNVDPRTKKKAVLNHLKVLLNFFLSIPLQTDNPVNPKLTNNPILLKVMEVFTEPKINVGTIIACWKSFKPAWRYLIKNHAAINFLYVQSQNDVLKDEKKVQNLLKNAGQKVILFNRGTHILSFDKELDQALFLELDKFIQNNSTINEKTSLLEIEKIE